jgi:uncharacterized damage-inducible protein DinB
MKEQVLSTWLINNKINLMLIEAINEDDLRFTLSKLGGRTIALQFAHLHNLRLWRLENFAKEYLGSQKKIDAELPINKQLLKTRIEESGLAYAKWINESLSNKGEINGFKKGVIPFVGFMIAHEAHHRGNIILTLKQNGKKLPHDIEYGIWDWDSI